MGMAGGLIQRTGSELAVACFRMGMCLGMAAGHFPGVAPIFVYMLFGVIPAGEQACIASIGVVMSLLVSTPQFMGVACFCMGMDFRGLGAGELLAVAAILVGMLRQFLQGAGQLLLEAGILMGVAGRLFLGAGQLLCKAAVFMGMILGFRQGTHGSLLVAASFMAVARRFLQRAAGDLPVAAFFMGMSLGKAAGQLLGIAAILVDVRLRSIRAGEAACIAGLGMVVSLLLQALQRIGVAPFSMHMGLLVLGTEENRDVAVIRVNVLLLPAIGLPLHGNGWQNQHIGRYEHDHC